ncbi:MAG: type II toxin-antitoxin system HigB family toxin [Gemmatimonadaceae bacterium]
MRVIARPALRNFAKKHAEAESSLNAWYHIMKAAKVKSPNELRNVFPEASFLGDGRTVFNVGSNRIETRIRYDIGVVFILDVMTHAEYDRQNVKRKR